MGLRSFRLLPAATSPLAGSCTVRLPCFTSPPAPTLKLVCLGCASDSALLELLLMLLLVDAAAALKLLGSIFWPMLWARTRSAAPGRLLEPCAVKLMVVYCSCWPAPEPAFGPARKEALGASGELPAGLRVWVWDLKRYIRGAAAGAVFLRLAAWADAGRALMLFILLPDCVEACRDICCWPATRCEAADVAAAMPSAGLLLLLLLRDVTRGLAPSAVPAPCSSCSSCFTSAATASLVLRRAAGVPLALPEPPSPELLSWPPARRSMAAELELRPTACSCCSACARPLFMRPTLLIARLGPVGMLLHLLAVLLHLLLMRLRTLLRGESL